MKLDPNKWFVKWFAFCVDRLPFTGRRNSYDCIVNGVSLCVFVWCSVWLPLILVSIISFVAWIFGNLAVQVYAQHGLLGVLAPFLFIAAMALAGCAAIGMAWLLFNSHDKGGVVAVIIAYLKALKDKVCPLITFEKSQ